MHFLVLLYDCIHVVLVSDNKQTHFDELETLKDYLISFIVLP